MAISGMTGFGRAEGASGDWSWAVEARSVNGRNLEVRFRAPPGLQQRREIRPRGGPWEWRARGGPPACPRSAAGSRCGGRHGVLSNALSK